MAKAGQTADCKPPSQRLGNVQGDEWFDVLPIKHPSARSTLKNGALSGTTRQSSPCTFSGRFLSSLESVVWTALATAQDGQPSRAAPLQREVMQVSKALSAACAVSMHHAVVGSRTPSGPGWPRTAMRKRAAAFCCGVWVTKHSTSWCCAIEIGHQVSMLARTPSPGEDGRGKLSQGREAPREGDEDSGLG